MIKHHNLQTQGILLALFAMLTFSINDGIFKYALQHASMEMVVFTGYVSSAIFLAVYGFYKKISFRPLKTRNGVIYGGLFLLEQTLFIYALKHLPISELFVVVLSTPVAVLILSHLILKEHLLKREILAVILGFGGAVIVVGTPFLSGTSEAPSSISSLAWGAAILNVLAGSSKIIYLRKYCLQENSFSLSFIAILFVTVFYFIWQPSNPFKLPALDLTLLFSGGCIGAIGCIVYINAFQIAKAALVSATQYSQIIWAILMGVFVFQEELTLTAITGSLLILASGYFLYLKKTSLSET